MSKIKCPTCKNEIDSNSKFCCYCGRKLNEKPSLMERLISIFTYNKTPKKFYERFIEVKGDIEKFNQSLTKNDYIDKSLKSQLKKDNKNNYHLCSNLKKNHNDRKLILSQYELDLIKLFIINYENIDSTVKNINKNHIDKLYSKFKENIGRYHLFIDKYKNNISYEKLVIDEDKNEFKEEYEFIKSLLRFEKSDKYDFGKDSETIHNFVEIYENFNNIKNQINNEINTRKQIKETFIENKEKILEFIIKYKNEISDGLYIEDSKSILNVYKKEFQNCQKLSNLPEEYHEDSMYEFLDIYNNFNDVSLKINENYLKRKFQVFSNKKTEIASQIEKYENLTVDDYLENKEIFLSKNRTIKEILDELLNKGYSFNESDLSIVSKFISLFNTFNGKFPESIYKSFLGYKFLITKFLNRYGDYFKCNEYIFEKSDVLKTYVNTYEKSNDIFKLNKAEELDLDSNEQDKIANFLNLYENFDKILIENNECYVKKLNEEYIKQKPLILKFIDNFNKDNRLDYYITDDNKSKIIKYNKKNYKLVSEMNKIPETANDVACKYIEIYENFDEIIYQMNYNYLNNLYKVNEIGINEYIDIKNLRQDYYISNSKLQNLLEKHNSYLNIVLELLKYFNDYDCLKDKNELMDFPQNPDELDFITPEANEAFIERELNDNKELFDSVVSGKPLDENQRRAVVIDEDNSQIIAGAGCGKTLTLQAKAKYLIERKNIDPSEILAISFSNYSADDLKFKMNQIGLDIDVSTFHALGLDILRRNNVKAKVDEYALKNAIRRYFVTNLINNDDMIRKIIEYFGYYMYEPLNKDKIDNIGEIYDYERGMDLETLYSKFKKFKDPTLKKTTLQGEKVKSLEERRIANFLFINGVKYTYEKEFEPKIDWQKTHDFLNKILLDGIAVPESVKKDLIYLILDYLELDEIIRWQDTGEEVLKYHPDFYLDDYDIYYEHFGVNRKCLAPWLPKRKSREYKHIMRNKRILHKKYGTALIETYSYYQSENRLLDRLSEKLKQKGVQFKNIDYKQFMLDLLHDEEKINEYWDFIKLVETFINLFKGNGYCKEKFEEFRKINEEKFAGFDKQKHELFLDIVEDIYDSYYEYLKKNKLIDFNDMINDACENVKTKGYYKNYKYIMVDEFQDTSHTRFNLLKAIKKDLNAKLIVVGDDWQSIYRFTGCDIDLFTDFETYFDNSKTEICYITNTYRNSQSLIDVAGSFIKKNEAQFQKELNSKANNQIDDTIKLYQFLNYLEQPFVFEAIINDIYNSTDEKYVNVLVLGRNRQDYKKILREDLFFTTGSLDDKNLEIHYAKNPKISISYMTVHGSKGLEEDNVVLINLEDKKNGFPNKIEDDSVLTFVKNEKVEPIAFPEERRLFYVGLTRTLERTYLLSPKDKKSIFVSELMDDIEVVDYEIPEDCEVYDGDEIRIIESTEGVCPECGTGKINLKYNPKTGKKFFNCSNWPRCDWFGGRFWGELDELKNPKYCPKCGGLMVKKLNSKTGEYFLSCINYFPNKACRYTQDISD